MKNLLMKILIMMMDLLFYNKKSIIFFALFVPIPGNASKYSIGFSQSFNVKINSFIEEWFSAIIFAILTLILGICDNCKIKHVFLSSETDLSLCIWLFWIRGCALYEILKKRFNFRSFSKEFTGYEENDAFYDVTMHWLDVKLRHN